MERNLSYFVADVHLGLDVADPVEREERFTAFLRSIPAERTENVFLLGDIWDFWYEYRDVVPKGYARIFATIQDLISAGVKVWFFRGNHDVWSYSYFEELGMKPLEQPCVMEVGGKMLCMGHGDGLGHVGAGYRILHWIFHNRVLQRLFSTIHPWIAFRFGNGWSHRNRVSGVGKGVKSAYVFDRATCPLYSFAEEFSSRQKVDMFVFGHYHVAVDEILSTGARFVILKDWLYLSPFLLLDAKSGFSSVLDGYSQNREK